MPRRQARRVVERVHRVRVHLRDEHLAARDGKRGKRAAELHFPGLGEVGQERLVGTAAALCVVAVGGPVLRVGVGGERGIEGRAFHEARGFGANRMRRACATGHRVEAIKLRLGVAGAVVRTGVGEAVGGHHAVETRAAHPVIEVPVLLLVVHELDARARGNQILLRRLRDVAAVVEPVGPVRHVRRELLLHLAGA